MIRVLRRQIFRFSEQRQNQHKKQQYLVFPTKFPIFPCYVYRTKLNKHLYEYLTKNNIKYVATFPLQPGVTKSTFIPYSRSHLQKQLGLISTNQKSIKNQELPETIEINYNNLIFDGPGTDLQEMPVHYVSHVSQIYPIGTICRLTASVIGQNQYFAHLRSQIRLQIDPQKYKNEEKPLMYVSGKTLRSQKNQEVGTNDYATLMQLYNRTRNISRVNLPEVTVVSIVRSIELLSGYLCTLSYFSPLQLYHLFSTLNLANRAKLLIKYYEQYIEQLEKNWQQLTTSNQSKIDESQKKETVQSLVDQFQYMLGYSGQSKYISKIKKKLASNRYPEHVIKVIECELQNLQQLGDGNPEINRKKHFINLLIDYPFGVKAQQVFDIEKARQILQQDHYGMKKIKQRILQFIAVSKLKGQFKSKVLLLHGPPGVGKTSIVKSIAKCLDRPYGRISLGGQYDVSIMKGHRKTYIGAYPGKIFDTIHKLKAENPVILLDEIDKIQARSHGASLQDCVMEILDPIQNYKFKDDFVDVEIDLSNVLFICTANSLETIFPPLLDRLERIQVSGYTTHQKTQIFKRYIQKQCKHDNGIPNQLQNQIQFTDQSINYLIEGYCKEAGVRNLSRKCNTIFQKIAYQYVQNQQFNKQITKPQIMKYLGLPTFHEGRMYPQIPPKGIIVGLAYNSYGGSIMYIESAASAASTASVPQQSKSTEKDQGQRKSQSQGIGTLVVTGNIQNVMKQSCQLAYSYARYITSELLNNDFLETNDVHLNFPQIQIGKDGPSAGVAITCSLISLALNKPAVREIAMTGEINLSGKVSAIGGVKEKTMGAKREGIHTLIFPEQNRHDIEQMEQQIKQGMTFHFASHFFQVADLVFGIKL